MRLDASDLPELSPVIRQVVNQTVAEIREHPLSRTDRIAYSEGEAAALCGIPRSIIRQARAKGLLNGSKAGRRIIILREDLFAWLRKARA